MVDVDAPRLMVTEPEFAENLALGEANGYLRPADERDIDLVLSWLREQEVVDERLATLGYRVFLVRHDGLLPDVGHAARCREALKRLVEAATTTVTARFTDEREIPALVSAISDARDVLSVYPKEAENED